MRVGLDGSQTPISTDEMDQVQPEDTRCVRLFLKADILELCDLIDMPGISDPNMSADVWRGLIDEADCVVWCTHATQAWRQSEAAVWDDIRGATRGENLLLVSQIDKLASERDRTRVMARLEKEAGDLFGAIHPVSLLDALGAGDDFDAWQASGADRFTHDLIDILMEASGRPIPAGDRQAAPDAASDARADARPDARPTDSVDAMSDGDPDESRITPKRVRLRSAGDGDRRPTARPSAGRDLRQAMLEASDAR